MSNLFEQFDKTLYRQGSPVYSGDGTPLSSISTLEPGSLGDGFSHGSTEVVQNSLQSGKFVTGVSGWKIDADGNVEFNNGTFRGTFVIGGALITISDITLLQSAINTVSGLGGGTVSLVPDTYNATSSFTIPSYVTLDGNGSTIDFGGGAYQILFQGSNAYSTGTVAISNDGTTVTGTGTTWTSAMIGRSILLEDFWYTISAVGGTTSITISRAYMGSTLSGSTYVIADTVNGVGLKNVIVQNSSVSLVKMRYINGMNIDAVTTITGLIGFDGDDSSFFNILNSGADLCGTGMTFDNFYFGTFFNNNITQCSTAGATFNSIRNWCIDVFAFVNITGNAMTFTSCSNNDILDFSIQHITGKGIEFVSGNSDIGVTAGVIKDCTSDGVKLTATSDTLIITNLQVHDNGGYGINIAASSCDNNTIIGNYFSTNTSGALNDSGTGTVVKGNSGIQDKKIVITTTQSATPTINTNSGDLFSITALAQAITSMTSNLSGNPVAGNSLIIEITDNGTARAITWGASFESSTVTLPTTTVISTKLTVGFFWNAATSKWRCVATA